MFVTTNMNSMEQTEVPAIYENIQRESPNIAEVSAACGIGRTKIYEAIASGRLKAKKFGKRTVILTDDLRAFLAALPSTS